MINELTMLIVISKLNEHYETSQLDDNEEDEDSSVRLSGFEAVKQEEQENIRSISLVFEEVRNPLLKGAADEGLATAKTQEERTESKGSIALSKLMKNSSSRKEATLSPSKATESSGSKTGGSSPISLFREQLLKEKAEKKE